MYKLLIYIGETIHNDETVSCIEYGFHSISKLTEYVNKVSHKMKEENRFFNYVVEEIKLEEKINLEEK